MRALRKGQAQGFNITRDIRGEARLVERAFGLGASPLREVVQLMVSGAMIPRDQAVARGMVAG